MIGNLQQSAWYLGNTSISEKLQLCGGQPVGGQSAAGDTNDSEPDQGKMTGQSMIYVVEEYKWQEISYIQGVEEQQVYCINQDLQQAMCG